MIIHSGTASFHIYRTVTEMVGPASELDSSCWGRTGAMLSLLLISLQEYRIISFDDVNKFQT